MNGHAHDMSIQWTGLALAVALPKIIDPSSAVMIVGSFWLGGFYLSPDLDLVQSNPSNRWGIFKLYWLPYRCFIPRHRHWLSHGVFVGSALRLLWVMLPIVIFLLWHPQVLNNELSTALLANIYIGVELSAWVHILLDNFPKK